ncbi:MAG: hypothetical protein IJZ35_01870 [Clostridia bacterium]|nr:hypothetical protein [Clostridia bacterium]
MTALPIIAGIIILFALILSIRAHIHIQYEADELTAYASWAFIKIPLIPAPEKQSKEKKPAPAKQETPAKEQSAPKEPKPKGPNPLKNFYENERIEGIIQILKKLLAITGRFGRRFVNSFVIDEMILDIIVSKSDAAQTAEEYGKMCYRVFPVTGAVCANCNVKKYAVNINPDYIGGSFNKYAFVMELSLNPRKLINAVLLFAFAAVFKVGIRVFKSMTKQPETAQTAQKNTNNENQNISESGA